MDALSPAWAGLLGPDCTSGATAGSPMPAPVRTAAASSEASGGTITGTVKAGAVPLPGVSVTATNTLTGKKYATTTDINGSFAMAIPRNGRYVVKAELAAFATGDAGGSDQRGREMAASRRRSRSSVCNWLREYKSRRRGRQQRRRRELRGGCRR